MRNLILSFWLTVPFCALAQTPSPWEIGLGAGIAGYVGETNQIRFGEPLFGIHPTFDLLARYKTNNKFAIRINLQYANISGDDANFTEPAWQKRRGFSFSAPLVELAAIGELYPFGQYKIRGHKSRKPSDTRRRILPFLAFGIGSTYSNPEVFWNDETPNEYLDPELAKLDKKNPNPLNLSIPVGLGIHFNLSKRLSLKIEALGRAPIHDYLDGISIAGDPEQNDLFWSTQAGLAYAFGKSSKPTRSPRKTKNGEEKPPAPDRDGDGIPDDRDECPDEPGLRSLFGCPDQDRDGVADKDDQCPTEVGLYALYGCPDRDGDGIADKDDSCPDIKGSPAYRGCPAIDRDQDGVADAEDLCPDMPGKLHWKGCPDSDGDGIPDNYDVCPGIAGPAHLRGCPDSDGDGVADKDDECPTIPGLIELNGCPETLPPVSGVPYKAVYFGSTLQDWHNTSVTTLEEVVLILDTDPDLFGRIEGHTDDTGRQPANDLLSEKRAKKCLDYLVSRGIDPKRLNYVGYGSQKPIVSNDSPESRQLNRRVEVYFYRKM